MKTPVQKFLPAARPGLRLRGVVAAPVFFAMLFGAVAALRADIDPTRVGYRDPNRPYAALSQATGTNKATYNDYLMFTPVFFTGKTTDMFDPAAWASQYIDMSSYTNSTPYGLPAGIPNDPASVNMSGSAQVVVNGTTFTTNYSTVVIGGTTFYKTGTAKPTTAPFNWGFSNFVTTGTLQGTTDASGTTVVKSGTVVPFINQAPGTVLVLGYKTTDGSYVIPDTTNDGPGAAARMKPYVGNGVTPLQLNFFYTGTGDFTQRLCEIQFYDNYALNLKGTAHGRYTLDLTDMGVFRWNLNDENINGTGIAGPYNLPDLTISIRDHATFRFSGGSVNASPWGRIMQMDSYWDIRWTRILLEADTAVLDFSAGTQNVIINHISGVPGSKIILNNTRTLTIGSTNTSGGNSTSKVSSNIASDISGGGGLTKVGVGHLYLSGSNSFSGGVSVKDGGALFINSNVNGNVTVGDGFLGGKGWIGGNVTTEGAGYVSPGAGPGTVGKMEIRGDLTISRSDFWMVMDIESPTIYDQLLVRGNANIAGSLALQILPGRPLNAGTYQVIVSQQPIIGNFIIATPNSLTIEARSPIAKLSPNTLEVYLFQKQFSEIAGLSPNAAQGAALVDKLLVRTNRAFGNDGMVDTWMPKAEAADLVGTLNAITGLRTMDRALGQIIPTAHRHWYSNAIAVSTDLVRRLEERISQPLAGDDYKWAIFGAASFLNTTMPGRDGAESIDANTSRFIGGVDYYATPNLTVTGYLSIDTTDAKVDPLGGTGDIKGNTIGLYLDYRFGKDAKWRLDATALYGNDDYDTHRSVMLTDLGVFARGTTSGERFAAALNLSRAFELPSLGVTLRPYAGMQYIDWNAEAFNETGATFPLHVDSQSASSLIGKAGLQFNTQFTLWKRPVRLFINAGWQFEFKDTERVLTGTFAGVPYSATFSEGKNNGYTGRIGIEADIYKRLTFTASIGRENGLNDFDNVSYYTSLSCRF